VIAHPITLALADEFLGPDAVAPTLASDICYQGSCLQEIHRDRDTFAFVLNVVLVDTREENGATELWPGTHIRPGGSFTTSLDESITYPLPDPDARGVLLEAPAGSLIIRDVRALHRGTANRTDVPRPMLNLNYDIGFPRVRAIPGRVPHHRVTNLLERSGVRLRQRAIDHFHGLRAEDHLMEANRLGSAINLFARSDRYAKRRIPADVWRRLSPRAQHLLRFAEVEGLETDDYREARSVRQSAMAFLVFGAFLAIKIDLHVREALGIRAPSDPGA